jgi:hypothetical protein
VRMVVWLASQCTIVGVEASRRGAATAAPTGLSSKDASAPEAGWVVWGLGGGRTTFPRAPLPSYVGLTDLRATIARRLERKVEAHVEDG